MPVTSLTAEIRTTKSPLYAFLHESFPLIPEVAKAARAGLAGLPMLAPPKGGTEPYQHGFVGTAFDYAVRLQLGLCNLTGTVAGKGISRVELVRLQHEKRRQKDPTSGFLRAIGTLKAGQELEEEFQSLLADAKFDPFALARVALMAARFEPVGRGAMWDPREFPNNLQELEAGISQGFVEDVAQLLALAEDRLGLTEMRDRRLNPVLGSTDVGADADLFADGCLYELKCAIKPTNDWTLILRQILGYILLAHPRELRVESVAVYMARYGIVTEWSVEELLSEVGGNPRRLRSYRRGFQDICAERGRTLLAEYEKSFLSGISKEPES